MIRPPGPEPATVVRSMPASLARRRFAGDVITRPARAMDTTAAGVAAAAGAAEAGAAIVGGAVAPSVNSNTISGEPTATLSPGAPVADTTRPLTGAGTSTAALSVITSTMS